MKKYLYGALAVTACFHSGASIATEVVVYGVVDTGVEYVSKANAAGNSLMRMPTLTGATPSRIGFKGTEDLGGGSQALFVLENGFGTDSGILQQGSRMFGRQALVGFKNAYGTLTLGRQYNMTLFSLIKSDVMGPNIHGGTNMDSYLPNTRSDNAIGYMGKFGEFTVGATYSFGRDTSAAGGPAATNCGGEVAGDSKACRQVTGLLAYDAKPFGISIGYDKLHGGTGAAGGLSNSGFYVERTLLTGWALVGKAKIGAGYIKRKTHVASDNTADLYFAGVSYPLANAWTLDTQAARFDVKNSPDTSTLFAAKVTHSLSKRTSVYTSVARVSNSGAAAIGVSAGTVAAPGVDQSGFMVGVRHAF